MKIYLTAFLLWIFHLTCNAQWVELNVGNFNTYGFTDVYAITPENVIVVGNNGLIIKSTDGGITWQQKNSGTTLNLERVQFPKSDTGYVTVSNGNLLKTTDGGDTWEQFHLENISIIDAISCVNEDLVFLNTDKGLTISEDGGVTWSTPAESPFFGQHGINMQFFNKNSGYIGIDEISYIEGDNWANRLGKTTDAGTSWQKFNAMAPFHFLNENLGFYYFSGLYKTINGGSQFEYVSNGTGTNGLRKISAIDENTIWGILDARALNWDASSQGIIKLTKNEAGDYTTKIWYDNNFDIDMTSMHFANENSGYIVGRVYGKNTLWKNSTGSNTTLNTTESDKINFKIFPNPTSDKINIQIDNQFSEKFSINITDMSGKFVYNQNYDNQKEISIDVRGFAKGIYFITVKNQKQSYSQKIIVK
ncbi:MAG: T9SS type A sorting domain-containing protein [Bergeyella sp.]